MKNHWLDKKKKREEERWLKDYCDELFPNGVATGLDNTIDCNAEWAYDAALSGAMPYDPALGIAQAIRPKIEINEKHEFIDLSAVPNRGNSRYKEYERLRNMPDDKVESILKVFPKSEVINPSVVITDKDLSYPAESWYAPARVIRFDPAQITHMRIGSDSQTGGEYRIEMEPVDG